ncbi:uncharacterized protein LOC129794983 isoform X2 [Lutzomyia longipalpis]|uniref:uncharacterized protein LOC129794983 isoform X2 n=1 Tax=Lutzomyia longipalpis TaxID=7200 RepID=UPI002483B2D9|nr:uncharacterized protein LOC129794983 isoform X2 [Lutzomyia longipalpis]
MEERNHHEGVCCPVGTSVNFCPAVHSLDTVRALHQTVVSLRTALDDARREIDKLKRQIHVQTDIEQGKIYRTNQPDTTPQTSARVQKDEEVKSEKSVRITKCTKDNEKTPRVTIDPVVSVTAEPSGGDIHEGKIRGMASKIDVKIKVSSNIHVDSSSSSEQNTHRSSQEEQEPPCQEDVEQKDDPGASKPPEESQGKTETFKTEGKSLKIHVTSEENLTLVKTGDEINITQNSNENLHLDIDDNSMSDGDNSVFTEGAITPAENPAAADEAAGEDKAQAEDDKEETEKKDQEEVDDIELIFSSDDNKDLMQEDLVSISDYEPWQAPGSSGTPVLVNYCSLPSEENPPEEPCEGITRREIKSCSSVIEKQTRFQQDSTESTETFQDKVFKSLEREINEEPKDSEELRRDESFDTFENYTPFGRKWTNTNVLIETDISKCGITEEGILDKGRRNTCPNPPAYRPMAHREALLHSRYSRCPFGVKFSRSAARSQYGNQYRTPIKPTLVEASTTPGGPKRSSSAQTDISALPEHWQSETHLAGGLTEGLYTLPSRFTPRTGISSGRCPLRPSEKTQEARRVLLSDIHFTSMVPELSRSADHLCHEGEGKDARKEGSNQGGTTETGNVSPNYHRGPFLRTPDYATRGITPSTSINSAGASQWTVNETSFGTQTPITGTFWGTTRGDSFDSTRSCSGSKYFSTMSRHHRSRSVPSVRCAICRQTRLAPSAHLRPSESMHYTPRVAIAEPCRGVQGSLPDLRHECLCPARRYHAHSFARSHGDSSGSTDSLLDEAEDFLRRSVDGVFRHETAHVLPEKSVNRRCSENDIPRDFVPSKQSLPFLPRTPKCLKPGHLAKVIIKNGRVVIGRIRYVGPVASMETTGDPFEDNTFVGLELATTYGDCDGTLDGKKFFDCEPLHGIFVPFKKVVMAWSV